jgi:hypothetical protein
MTTTTIETSLIYILSQDSTVVSLAGNRGYPLVIPIDSELPAWAYQLISGMDGMAHGGPTGTNDARIQITVTADSYEEAKTLAIAINAALSGYRGDAVVDESYEIESSIIENIRDGYNQTVKTYTIRLDVLFIYKTS